MSCFYYAAPDAKERAYRTAESEAGFPEGTCESFLLDGRDPRFHGAPQGSWCIALVDGAAPPPGFEQACPAEASASTSPPTPAEMTLAAGNAFLDAARLRLLTIGME